MKLCLVIPAALALVVLTACEPKERALWSPDGRRAAVLIEHRLHFADETGRLTGALATTDADPGSLLVERMDWSADSRSLVIHRVRLVPGWEELEPLLPETESDRIENLAGKMPALLASAAALHGDADRVEQLLAKLAGVEHGALLNALRLALVKDRGAVEASLTDAPKARASLSAESGGEEGFFLHELALVKVGDSDGESSVETISRSLRSPVSLKLSPVFPVLAVALSRGEGKGHDLELISLDGNIRETVATETSAAFAWTPDGRSLVSLAPVAGGSGPLMRLLGRELLDEGGVIDVGKMDERAIAVIPFAPRLAVLPDGGTLFASQSAGLPMAVGESGQPRLYLVPPGDGAIREIPTGEGALPMDLGYFALSPDGRRLAVVESGTDAVAVIDLASGASELVSPPHPGWKCRTLPSWKSSEALSYASLEPSTNEVRWMLWKSAEESQDNLSADWPAGATKGWLEKNENPATP